MSKSPNTIETSFDALHRRAKMLEGRLETKVQRYSSLAQKINADFYCDEENPMLESTEEHDLSLEIDRDLQELHDCINSMRQCNSLVLGSFDSAPVNHREGLIKRYNEIHFDYSTEFKNTSSTVNRKRETHELFVSASKNNNNDVYDSSVAKLLRERSGIAQSMRSINDVISQAFEAKTSLFNQRQSLSASSGSARGLVSNFFSFNRLIDGINKRKGQETFIIALLIGILIFFMVWWMFLR